MTDQEFNYENWGDPDTKGFEAAHIIVAEAGGIRVRLHREVVPLFKLLINELAKHYNIKGHKDDWGFNNRDIRGHPGVKSNHAWGKALDLDATVNPMTRNPHARHEFVKTVVDPILKMISPAGHLRWGGEYNGPRKDYMHFEWMGTIPDARKECARLRKLHKL